MKGVGLRHLRMLLAVADAGSVTKAASACAVSQPAISQALAKLEKAANGALFNREARGLVPTERGQILLRRVRRVFARLDPALGQTGPRLRLTATTVQLEALIAVVETGNFSLAARRLGLAQPTVHRAVRALETEADRPLFDRRPQHIVPGRAARRLASAARLAFAEMAQAATDLSELDGTADGQIVIGALPLSRSTLLPRTLARFRAGRRALRITVVDGVYDEVLSGLRRGQIDIIIGAMRDPLPVDDVVQEPLFHDGLCIVAGLGHPLADRAKLALSDLAPFPWVVARQGAPARDQFNDRIGRHGAPPILIETGSILLMRGLLQDDRHLGCVSSGQAASEIAAGLMRPVALDLDWSQRPIGLTTRKDWLPTRAQAELLSHLREEAKAL